MFLALWELTLPESTIYTANKMPIQVQVLAEK